MKSIFKQQKSPRTCNHGRYPLFAKISVKIEIFGRNPKVQDSPHCPSELEILVEKFITYKELFIGQKLLGTFNFNSIILQPVPNVEFGYKIPPQNSQTKKEIRNLLIMSNSLLAPEWFFDIFTMF